MYVCVRVGLYRAQICLLVSVFALLSFRHFEVETSGIEALITARSCIQCQVPMSRLIIAFIIFVLYTYIIIYIYMHSCVYIYIKW